MAEIHTERKKSQKTKVKPTSDGRKQLSSVRVIQRNLVYIVGLPLNLADEDVASPSNSLSQHICALAHICVWLIEAHYVLYFYLMHLLCSFCSVENILLSMGRF